jgi:hypothetical protein
MMRENNQSTPVTACPIASTSKIISAEKLWGLMQHIIEGRTQAKCFFSVEPDLLQKALESNARNSWFSFQSVQADVGI